MQVALTLAALILLQQPQATPRQGTAVLEGTITRAGSGLPVEGAVVGIGGDNGFFSTVTETDGRYVLRNLPAGAFVLEVLAQGYVFESKSAGATPIQLTLADKQRLQHNVSLIPLGVIRGRILDDNREPLARITVELLRYRNDTQGRPVWATAGVFTTDKKGEYRFENLYSGEYYVRASRKPTDEAASGSRVDVAATYFPGTSDARSALAIRLRAADDQIADFSLVNARTYAVSGRVSRPDMKRIDSELILFAIPQDPRMPLDDVFAAGVAVKASADRIWDFDLHGFLPGVYDLFVATQTSFSGTQTTTKDANGVYRVQNILNEIIRGRFARTTIQISNEDIKDIRLSLEPGVDVNGRVEVVDTAGKPFPFEIRRIGRQEGEVESTTPQLALSLDHKPEHVPLPLDLQPAQKEFPEPNMFVIEAVPAGTYTVQVQAFGGFPDFYVADIRAGARSVFDDGLTVSTTDPGPLEVVVGLDGGKIDGTITGGKNLPVLVVLAPIFTRRQNGELFKTAVLERASDSFQITGVAPGPYSLFAFEVSSLEEIVPYRSANFLSLYDARSTLVTAHRNTVTGPVQVQIIPRQQWNP